MGEIKISELSIGDWVMNTKSNSPNRVIGLRTMFQDTYEIIAVGDDTQYMLIEDNKELHNFEFLPLTPEILEKNGFDAPKAKVWNDSWYWSNRKDVALELRESFGLWYMEIVTKEQRSGLQSNRKLGIGFKYVHQLQHALRLAGVEKEIEV